MRVALLGRHAAAAWAGIVLVGCGASQPVAKTEPTVTSPRWTFREPEVEFHRRQSVPAAPTPIMGTLEGAAGDAFRVLHALPEAVHYLAYQVTDERNWRISAAHGSLVTSTYDRQRYLDVDVRVGTPVRDNTHPLPGESNDSTYEAVRLIPLADAGQALRDALWLATNDEYERARQAWLHVVATEEREQESAEEKHADFSTERPVVGIRALLSTAVDVPAWEQRVAELSAIARAYPDIMDSEVSFEVVGAHRYFVSSEGSRVQTSERRVRLSMRVSTLARDGMPLERFDAIDVHTLDGLPQLDVAKKRFARLFRDVIELRDAPLIDPYAGPALLEGRAAGVFFHEVFGHRIEGHRQDAQNEGQTFATLIGQQILPEGVDVFDDPSLFTLNGVELNGNYAFDDEGIAAQRATLVQDGVLRGFLLSRAPTRGFDKSNGHGRREMGYGVVSRQANLVVLPHRAVSRSDLDAALIAEVERQGLPYGLRFTDISGGFTQTQRFDTQAFKVMPVMAYRVYPDGRHELVRGADIEGTPLTALSKIALLADDFETFNGVCGAESGWVPVSATSPSVLVSQLEIARQEQSELKPPLLPPPGRAHD